MTLAERTEQLRQALQGLRELERDHPAAVQLIIGLLVAHLRAWHPEAVTPLGILGPPTEPIRDPRSG